VNPALIFVASIHCVLLASLIGRGLRKFESGRTFSRLQVWRAAAIAVAALYAPALAPKLFDSRAWLPSDIALQTAKWIAALLFVMRYALSFLVHWIVFRICLRDASGLPLSWQGNLWLAGLSTALIVGLKLFALLCLGFAFSAIRGP
jgi:hypothetical protein